jgi:hypothetical protein
LLLKPDEVEPAQIAVEVFGGDAAMLAEEILEPGMSVVYGLDVKLASDPLLGGLIERLVADAEGGGAGRVAGAGVGDEQGVLVDDRPQGVDEGRRIDTWQNGAGRDTGAVGGDQDRNQLTRNAALAGLAAPLAGLSAKVTRALAAGQDEGFVGLDDATQFFGPWALAALRKRCRQRKAVLIATPHRSAEAATVSPSARV